ncbi:hypothetical protein MSPP1_003060 [Malassezia sp. CBS 17886]|nr:hypothetical protein MSPP1_003060 [Malassezia sp. CBS 17886]
MSAAASAPPARLHGAGASYQAIPQSDEALLRGEVDADDFKFGVTVEQSAPEIRAMFIRKVYTILFLQILGTTVVAGAMTTANLSAWIQQHAWLIFIPMLGSFVSLGLVYWKRHAHPANLFMLGLFTAAEALTLGCLVTFMDQVAVLKALALTTFIFLGLTLFTFQTQYDLSSLGTYLYWGLLLLVGTGLLQMFFPYSHAFELGYSVAGCVVFSGYILYDTYLLQRQLSSEDWVLANVSLYLDVVNLFISLLRLMNSSDD